MGKILVIKDANFSKSAIENAFFVNGYINNDGQVVTHGNEWPDSNYGYIPKFVMLVKNEVMFFHHSELAQLTVPGGFSVRFTVSGIPNFRKHYNVWPYIRGGTATETSKETTFSIDAIYAQLNADKDSYPYITASICYTTKQTLLPEYANAVMNINS